MTLLNFVSFCLLAVSGSVLVLAARRILAVIKATELRISESVDAKNIAAAELKVARRDEAQIRSAIDEADAAILAMTKAQNQAEARILRLKASDRMVVNMVDNEWRKFDRFFEATVTNPKMPAFLGRGPGSATGWAEGRAVSGFARSADEFRDRLAARFPAKDGFLLGQVQAKSLLDDDSLLTASRAADASQASP
jgi:hypothetical protein